MGAAAVCPPVGDVHTERAVREQVVFLQRWGEMWRERVGQPRPWRRVRCVFLPCVPSLWSEEAVRSSSACTWRAQGARRVVGDLAREPALLFAKPCKSKPARPSGQANCILIPSSFLSSKSNEALLKADSWGLFWDHRNVFSYLDVGIGYKKCI